MIAITRCISAGSIRALGGFISLPNLGGRVSMFDGGACQGELAWSFPHTPMFHVKPLFTDDIGPLPGRAPVRTGALAQIF